MSSAESNERNTTLPKNAIWLQTYYYTIPHNVLKMEHGQAVQTPLLKFDWIEDRFTFQFARINEITFGAFAVRFPTNPNAEVDGGYILQFQFTMVGSKEDMKTAYLYPTNAFTNVFFSNACFFEPYLMYEHDKYYFDLKVIVNMWEYDNLSNEARQQQEHQLSLMKSQVIKSEDQLQRLCKILKIPALENIFTGRQDSNFANWKTTAIAKTAVCAKALEYYFEAKKKGPLPAELIEKMGPIVNYILTDKQEAIPENQLHTAYVAAYDLGLDFLKEVTRDLAMRRLTKMRFLINMATTADKFGDKVLFDKMAPAVRFFLPKIKETPFWSGLVGNTPYIVRSLLHSMKVRENTYELHVALPSSSRETTEL